MPLRLRKHAVLLVRFSPLWCERVGGWGMWYFVAGAVVGVAQLILRSPIQFFKGSYPVQGALTSAALGAAVYGTIFWLIGSFVF